MQLANFFKINQRQNRALIYQLIAIFISWICCYLTNFVFGVFMLTEMLVAGAIIYSNEDFLKYNLKRSILITVVLVVFFSVFQLLMQLIGMWLFVWIWSVSINPIIIESVVSYVLITAVLKITQKQVEIGLGQLLFSAALLLIYYIFFYNNSVFGYSQKGYYVPFFINQFFVSLYAVSMMNFVEQELIGVEAIQVESVNLSPQPKKMYKFVNFMLFTVLGVGILFLLFILMVIWIWSGVTFETH